MYLVSYLTSVVTSATCKSWGPSELGWRRCRGMPGWGGSELFQTQGQHPRSPWVLSSTLSGLEAPCAKCGFQKKDPSHIWKPINWKSSRHFHAWDLFICEEYIILLNYGLWGDGVKQRKKPELRVRDLGLNHGSALPQLWGTDLGTSGSLSMNQESPGSIYLYHRAVVSIRLLMHGKSLALFCYTDI